MQFYTRNWSYSSWLHFRYISLESRRKTFRICTQFFSVLFYLFYLGLVLSYDQEPDPRLVGIRIRRNLFLRQRERTVVWCIEGAVMTHFLAKAAARNPKFPSLILSRLRTLLSVDLIRGTLQVTSKNKLVDYRYHSVASVVITRIWGKIHYEDLKKKDSVTATNCARKNGVVRYLPCHKWWLWFAPESCVMTLWVEINQYHRFILTQNAAIPRGSDQALKIKIYA